MPNTKLVLGSVTFQGFEIPDKLKGLGGVHNLSVFNYVGTKKGIHALGPKPSDVSWKGAFVYSGATDRIKKIDNYRISGEVVRLSWGEFAYNVIVKSFLVEAQHEFEFEYDIVLEVVEDLTNIPDRTTTASADEGVLNSFSRADLSIQNLQSDPNFTQVALSNGAELPDDPATTLAYIKDPIIIQGPPVQTAGSLG